MSQWLVQYQATSINNKKIADKEEKGNIEKDNKYFVFNPNAEDSSLLKKINNQNIEKFKIKLGLIRSEQQLEQVVETVGKKSNASKRYNDLVKLNNRTAQFFLSFLNELLWDEVDLVNGIPVNNEGNFSIYARISGVDIDSALDTLKPLLNQIAIYNEHILDLKYNPKLVTAEISHRLEKLTSETAFSLNPFKSSKK